jgi:hypothetical protein
MNGRINDLALQAHDYTGKVISSTGWLNGDEIFEQKFAELIIRECALLSDQFQFEKNTSNPLRVKPLPLVPSEFINEHFGVEE